jgi:hypothetical protein
MRYRYFLGSSGSWVQCPPRAVILLNGVVIAVKAAPRRVGYRPSLDSNHATARTLASTGREAPLITIIADRRSAEESSRWGEL